MIYAITVINDKGEAMRMQLDDPWTSGMAVMSVTGLGPGPADINTTAMASSDGSRFNSARLQERNIVMNLRYFPTEEDGGVIPAGMSYNYLSDKPSINGVELVGNKVSHELKIQDEMTAITEERLDEIIGEE